MSPKLRYGATLQRLQSGGLSPLITNRYYIILVERFLSILFHILANLIGIEIISNIFTAQMSWVAHFGRYIIFLRGMFSRPEKFWVYADRTVTEMNNIGTGSLAIVAIIAVFQGAVTTLQIAYQLISPLIAAPVIGSIVSDSSMLELAPTITCLVLAGKVGSHIASEIGTMRVSEQIDALEVMGINASSYLALPKIVAGLIMIPLLVIISIFLSNTGGIIAGQASGILTPQEYMQGARESFLAYNLFFSILKSFTYAFIITSVSAYHGYFTHGGALEVGSSSTKAVVYSAVAILFADYILAQLLL